MRPIKQEDPFGCGVACIASILGINYQTALNLFDGGKEKAKATGFYCREIVKTLGKVDLKYEYKYIKPKIRKRTYTQGAIVFLRRSKKYPKGHYLSRSENMWLDPWVNFPLEEIKKGFRKRLPEKPIFVIYPVTIV